MVELLCILLPFAGIPLWFLIAGAVDLVRQDERVQLWWALAFAPALPLLPLALGVPFLVPPGLERATTASALWTTALFAAAGTGVGGAMALAVARGLRPGGETERRVRTSLIAAALLIGSSTIVVLGVPISELFLLGLWLVPASWGGLAWVLFLNRRGPARLEHGKRVSASWLFGAGLLFVLGVVHAVQSQRHQDPTEELVMGALAAVGGALALCAGLWFLAGPLPRASWAVPLVATLTLLHPAYFDWTFRPVPPGTPLPVWEDALGRRVDGSQAVWRQNCVRVLPAGTQHGECRWGDDDYAAPPDTRLAELTWWGDFLLDDGRRSVWIPGDWHSGPTARVEVVPGQGWKVDGELRETPEGFASAAQRFDRWEQVGIRLTPELTLQDYVRACATLPSRSCVPVRDPVPGEPVDPNAGLHFQFKDTGSAGGP